MGGQGLMGAPILVLQWIQLKFLLIPRSIAPVIRSFPRTKINK
jgi:hypothetical protein